MLIRIVKSSFGVIGLLTGFTLTRLILYYNMFHIESQYYQQIAIYIIACLLFGALFYTSSGRMVETAERFLDKLESSFQKMSVYEIIVCAIGLTIGLAIANLVTIPIKDVNFIGVPISIVSNILFGFLGISLTFNKKDELVGDFVKSKHGTAADKSKTSSQKKILDTSAIIDGRIADVCRAGFMDGELVVPGFVLEELRHIADLADPLKRNRGRRGLDIINIIQKELKYPLSVEKMDFEDVQEVDEKLLKLALAINAKVITTDYNLNKVAGIQGVEVLNLNELTNAVKPLALPGEEMKIQMVKDGKENGQGVGYLDDGTMIVVDGGKRFMGENIEVVVTSVLQTAAGRMIFAKPKYSIEKVV